MKKLTYLIVLKPVPSSIIRTPNFVCLTAERSYRNQSVMAASASASATDVPREFICLFEQNTKENETFIFYLQWNGNEEELKKLYRVIMKAEFCELDGDHISAFLDIDTKLPESVVDLHRKVKSPNGYHRMFTKCTGKFTCPFSQEEIETNDEYELAVLYNKKLYSTVIQEWFSNYRNLYNEYLYKKITKEEYLALKDQ